MTAYLERDKSPEFAAAWDEAIVVAAARMDDVTGELERFTGDPDQDAHDDVVDTLSYMAELLPNLEPAARGTAALVVHRPATGGLGR